MLKLTDIVKDYEVGNDVVHALKGISIEFRKNEFVAILGPSGCGKTTLLNIIGGLDKYTSGDLSINGKSTKQFNDADWDSYRNHSVGFVFQSYNLIPHQTVLANVELALTLSGVGKAERRKRAIDALNKVGLGDQLNKKPNQMSGGQMQRVAIARALVNDPEILMADEPTGALDSATSVQIMDLLKEVAKDRLVIMVTHNPELAEKYATRIVRCLDGEVISDSDPYVYNAEEEKNAEKKILGRKKTSMSFFTALSLSLNNLMTKKGRTILTSFAGSIGIIGIALILSVSTGVQTYINRVQEDTLSSYPITINAQEVDLTSMLTSLMSANQENQSETHELDAVYENRIMSDLMDALSRTETRENNLEKFKEFLENSDEIKEYASSIGYVYDTDMNVYVTDADGNIVKSDVLDLISRLYSELGVTASSSTLSSYMQMDAWQELLSGMDGELINPLMKEQYEVVSGRWPENYDEVVVAVDENNEISDVMLYALGLKTMDQILDDMDAAASGEGDIIEEQSWSYDDILGLDFRIILNCDKYQKSGDGYIDATTTEAGLKYLYESDNSIKVKVVGIIRKSDNAVSSFLNGAVGYTSALTDYILDRVSSSELIAMQKENPDVDVLTGLKFPVEGEEPSEDEIKAAVDEWSASLSEQEKAVAYTQILSVPSDEYLSAGIEQFRQNLTPESEDEMLLQAIMSQTQMDEQTIRSYIEQMDEEEKEGYMTQIISAAVAQQYAAQAQEQLGAYTTEQLAAMYDATPLTTEQYSYVYENLLPATVSDSTYEQNLKLLGDVDKGSPSSIYIYASTFEDKDNISDLITTYNESAADEDQISYTDYVKLLMSSITTIINAISYVLIAFVAISLVVSSIMIGIITYISVLERTKEIGILRAVGASKRDISRVFNAETMIEGFVSGALGIIITLLLLIPINIILHSLTGIQILSAILPVGGAIILVAISIILTLIAGLIPSGIAAKKDPVEALRTE
ncbi:MAG TPA: ABC transporter ATP-binding protein/permease [Candidatus Faeciplasma gallinarum]|uniref:ABC transporter ATP-binding protein/permease n=1 Tax=Candidatus Faeciplasma gallinarum TaxID=2840799 RepID=A0A9D1ENB7_9FIRM|nr:ABC transporter ATP-binding protein/permease [Candidatus Faeciplasma gallinarum]